MMSDQDIRRKRLLYVARHRGTQEGDLVLGGFAERYVSGFDAGQLEAFEALLDQTDADLMDWISGRTAPPKSLDGPVFRLLMQYKENIISN